MRRPPLLAIVLLAALVILPLPLMASPIVVSYTVTGYSEDWTLGTTPAVYFRADAKSK